MGHFAIASSKYSTHTLFSRGVFKEDTQFQMPDDIMTFSSINFKWYSVFSAGTMLTEREWNANWQSSTKLKIKHSNGAHYLSHTQQWIREAEGCNEQWAYWQCVWNSTFISRQYPFTMEHKKAQYVMRFSRWRTAVVMRLHGFAQCVIIIEANKDHTSVDLCLLCLNARCAKWLMPDNVSQWPLSPSFLYVCGINRARTKRNTKRGKKGKIIYSSGVTRTIHKYCHSISMVIDWILRAVGWCSVWCAAWMVRVCMGLEYKNATSLVSLRCDWSLNKWLGSHLKWKKHCWKLAIGSILVESNQRDVNGSAFPHFHSKCCIVGGKTAAGINADTVILWCATLMVPRSKSNRGLFQVCGGRESGSEDD